MRIPAAPVTDGESILACPQYAERGFFIEGGRGEGRFTTTGSAVPAVQDAGGFAVARPTLTRLRRQWRRAIERRRAGVVRCRCDAALRRTESILDLSTFWAGAYLTCYLGALGADVVKIESIQRPDGHRYSGALLREGDDWYERGPLWQGTNLNKRDITLDLTSEAGRELALRLAAEADVVVENFSPRVVEQFGLDYDSLAKSTPPHHGAHAGLRLGRPWRDYVGWALNIEQLSGMSATTGYPDGPPCNLQGPADPIAGVHASVALLAALGHRERTGEGQLIEVAQIEVGAAVTAEPVIEYSMTGLIRGREGNRHREYAQGVYPASGQRRLGRVSVRDDSDWAPSYRANGRAELQHDPRFESAEARRAHT